MDESTMLHIWKLLKILFLSSKICKRLPFFLFLPYFFNCSFSLLSRLSRFVFFLYQSSIFICSFFSLLRLSCIVFFPLFSYFLNCSFSSRFKLSRFSFFFCCPPFLNVLFAYHQSHQAQLSFIFSRISSTVFFSSTFRLQRFSFFLQLSSLFKCSLCSSTRLSCIAFFPFFSYFLNCSFS